MGVNDYPGLQTVAHDLLYLVLTTVVVLMVFSSRWWS